eukprot:NODE_2437_length_925_cov_181.130137_g2005_i0.p1 GENE.NODE_2437_length_925_cov_181.130137_g2005_i0~~NODE_2437_length_925_cov_181.130137_g2005_i0.p1  ORF type:complete len:208 (-),score=81.64 NODE_2437_length_925_cov_181.130137_g2005_i0:302-865(-)
MGGGRKLGGGTYALPMQVQGKGTHIVLNAFHPMQLQPFTTPGRGIIAMEGLSDRSWMDLRQKICGATNPFKAQEGSVRATLLKEKEALRLPEVDMAHNCVHMSAGPVEGMVEVLRFFHSKDHPLSLHMTGLGQMLYNAGMQATKIAQLTSNPDMVTTGGKRVSAFDLTEEVDAKNCLALLLPHPSKL